MSTEAITVATSVLAQAALLADRARVHAYLAAPVFHDPAPRGGYGSPGVDLAAAIGCLDLAADDLAVARHHLTASLIELYQAQTAQPHQWHRPHPEPEPEPAE